MIYFIVFITINFSFLRKIACNGGIKFKEIQIFRAFNSFKKDFKSILLIQTSVCILACDFQHFPNIHRKTEYGFSLMDTGIGFFILNTGLSNNRKRVHMKRKIGNLLSFLIIGTIRMIIMYRIGKLNCDFREYGNFFNNYFLIGMILFLFYCIVGRIHTEKKLCYSLIVSNLLSYPISIIFKVDVSSFQVLLNGLNLMLIGTLIGKYTIIKKNNKTPGSKKIIKLFGFLCVVFLVSSLFTGPNRKLLNLSYITLQSILFCCIGMVYSICNFEQPRYCLHIFEKIRKKAKLFYFTSNLLVLFINVLLNTNDLAKYIMHIIMIIYLGVSFLSL